MVVTFTWKTLSSKKGSRQRQAVNKMEGEEEEEEETKKGKS